ncbi:MAG: type II secretion system protein [Synergistaceae bacterium]|nr:type II secretion system protein [Synergistaceae bacterium]MBQ7169903.1 type II secretion system protein [Synergistaceae bacterium]
MKKMRKGFTLVELLIVVAILATLTATMTASISGSTAKAKASAIANNVEAMKSAASQYYSDHMEESSTLASATTATVLDAYIPTWRDFQKGDIKYIVVTDDSDAGRSNWAITVDFSNDGEAEAIKTALAKIKGYGDYNGETTPVTKPNPDYVDATTTPDEPETITEEEPAGVRVRTGAFKVTLWNGAIESVAATPNS